MPTYTPAAPWGGPYPVPVVDNFGNNWEAYGPNQLKKPTVAISTPDDCCLYTTEVTDAYPGDDGPASPPAFIPAGKSAGDTYMVKYDGGIGMFLCDGTTWVWQWGCALSDATVANYSENTTATDLAAGLATAPASPANGDIHCWTHGLGLDCGFAGWIFDGTDWKLTSHKTAEHTTFCATARSPRDQVNFPDQTTTYDGLGAVSLSVVNTCLCRKAQMQLEHSGMHASFNSTTNKEQNFFGTLWTIMTANGIDCIGGAKAWLDPAVYYWHDAESVTTTHNQRGQGVYKCFCIEPGEALSVNAEAEFDYPANQIALTPGIFDVVFVEHHWLKIVGGTIK